VQTLKIMAFSLEKRMSLVEVYRKTESFKTTQSDYSQRFGCPVAAKSVIIEVCYIGQAGNVIIPKHVRRSNVVAEARVAEVSDRLGASPRNSLWKHAQGIGTLYRNYPKAAKTFQLFPYQVCVIQHLLPPGV
jgi:hypothetical protein